MKKVYKIMISSLMVASFTIQHASDYFEPGAGAGAGAGGDSASSSSFAFSGIQEFNPEATRELLAACRITIPQQLIIALNRAEQAIQDGADVNQVDDEGRTPLYCACDYNNFAMVELLLRSGAKSSINQVDNDRFTPLHLACLNNNFAMVKLLLRNGAQDSINQANNENQTPLYWACRWNNLDMVKLLLRSGARSSINQADRYNQTPLHWSYVHNNFALVQLLLDATNEEGQPALDLSVLDNINALHNAINEDQVGIVQAIITSKNFGLQNSITVQEIINSLQTTLENEYFVPREGEPLFNNHYPALEENQRNEVIAMLEDYLHSGLK